MNQSPSTTQPTTPSASAFAELLANFGPVQIKRNSLIQGTVVSISSAGALVDVGAKSDSFVSADECGDLQVGQTAQFYVDGEPDEDGQAVLSYAKARSWTDLQQLQAGNLTEEVTIKSMVKPRNGNHIAGAVVYIRGLRGFIPSSQLAVRGKAIERMVGKTIGVKVLELNAAERKIVLSQRMAQEEEQASFFANAFAGQIVSGVVTGFGNRRLGETDVEYGAFVDIGCGISGLLHKSEINHDRNAVPSQVLAVGQELELVLIAVDPTARKVSLSLRRVGQGRFLSTLQHGQVVTGKIARVKEFGAFIELGGCVDGLLHTSEMAVGTTPRNLKVGDPIEVVIVTLDAEQEKISLSTRQLPQVQS